jgi:ribonuclease D
LIHLYNEQNSELKKTSKLSWLNQDIDRLLKITFNSHHPFMDIERTISKAQEQEVLFRFNKIVEIISKREKINPTLFFSKKVQKDFLRFTLIHGLDSACAQITSWRSALIKKEFLELLK